MKKYFMLIALCIMTSICFAQDVYDSPDVYAEYPGGLQAMMKFVSDNYKYPEGVEGRVIVSFVVDTDGSVTDIRPMKSPDKRATDEAIRVLKMMPKWTPAQEKGKVVKMLFTLPITLKPGKGNVGQALTLEQCYKVSKSSVGHKQDPKGLYRLLSVHADSREKDIIPSFEQYKYCGDSLTLHVMVEKDVKDSGAENVYQFSVVNNDNRAFKYTGNLDNKDESVFDSDDKSFKLKWYNSSITNEKEFPFQEYSTELYSSTLGIDPRMMHAVEMLEGKFKGTNKLAGCWYLLGEMTKVEGMDVLNTNHEAVWTLMDDEGSLCCFDINSKRLNCYFTFSTVNKYFNDELLKEKGVTMETVWQNERTVKVIYTTPDGKTTTMVWTRSGLPSNLQCIFGTNFPVFKFKDSLHQ